MDVKPRMDYDKLRSEALRLRAEVERQRQAITALTEACEAANGHIESLRRERLGYEKEADRLTREKLAAEAALAGARKDAVIVCDLLELGDSRLLASDGPAGGKLPDLSPDEWGKVYRACKRIRALAQKEDGHG